MKFVRAHRPLELRSLDHLAHKGVGIEQHVVIEEHVVDADDAVAAQLHVVEEGRAGVELHAEAVMEIVVEIRAGRDDPVDKARVHQRHDRGFAQPRRRQRAGERHADRPLAGDHLLREEPARLREPAAVVGLEGGVDEVGDVDPFLHGAREQPWKLFVERAHAWPAKLALGAEGQGRASTKKKAARKRTERLWDAKHQG